MAYDWFRMWVSIVESPKFFELDSPESETRFWLVALALYMRDRKIDEKRLGFFARSDPHTPKLIESLIAKGFFERVDGDLIPHHWDHWQFDKDGEPHPERNGRPRTPAERKRDQRMRDKAARDALNGASGHDATPNVTMRDERSQSHVTVTSRVTTDSKTLDLETSDLSKQAGSPGSARAREGYDALEDALLGALPEGARSWPVCGGTAPLMPIETLLQGDYDLGRDILPSITRQAQAILDKGGKPIGQWKYFVPGIMDDWQKRRAAPALGAPSTPITPALAWHGKAPFDLHMDRKAEGMPCGGSQQEWFEFFAWWHHIAKLDARLWDERWRCPLPGTKVWDSSWLHAGMAALWGHTSQTFKDMEGVRGEQRRYWLSDRGGLKQWIENGGSGWKGSNRHGPEPGHTDSLVPGWLVEEVRNSMGGVASEASTSTPDKRHAVVRGTRSSQDTPAP